MRKSIAKEFVISYCEGKMAKWLSRLLVSFTISLVAISIAFAQGVDYRGRVRTVPGKGVGKVVSTYYSLATRLAAKPETKLGLLNHEHEWMVKASLQLIAVEPTRARELITEQLPVLNAKRATVAVLDANLSRAFADRLQNELASLSTVAQTPEAQAVLAPVLGDTSELLSRFQLVVDRPETLSQLQHELGNQAPSLGSASSAQKSDLSQVATRGTAPTKSTKQPANGPIPAAPASPASPATPAESASGSGTASPATPATPASPAAPASSVPVAPTQVRHSWIKSTVTDPPVIGFAVYVTYPLPTGSSNQSFNVYVKSPSQSSFTKYSYTKAPYLKTATDGEWVFDINPEISSKDASSVGQWSYYITALSAGGLESSPSATKTANLYGPPQFSSPANGSTTGATPQITITSNAPATNPKYIYNLSRSYPTSPTQGVWWSPAMSETNFAYNGPAITSSGNPYILTVYISSGLTPGDDAHVGQTKFSVQP